jgi:hypothetical protein
MINRQYYQQKASACFNKVADILKHQQSPLPFWHVGRTFNTCHDYITQNAANEPLDLDRYKNEVRPGCIRFYLDQAGKPDNNHWWWDDYGWWGLALLAAGDLQNAKDCWLRMKAFGVDSGQLGPDYLGGCWNHTTKQEPPGCENSVTNSTFFLLSLRLLNNASFRTDPLRNEILTAAGGSARWLDHWLDRPGALLNPLQLLRERPVGDKDNIFPFGAPDYEVGWIWTGDQGLALAWAAESFELTQADWHAVFPGAPYRAKAFQMAGQIRHGMAPLFDADGVLHEAPYWANSYGNYNTDYSSGRGVFMRYISRADRVFRQEPGWVSSDTQTLHTADAVIARLGEQSPTMYSWSHPREQDVLNAWKAHVTGESEGDPCLCNDAALSTTNTTQQLVFYGIALDTLTAATAATQ